MIRLSVTDLDAYRRYRDNEDVVIEDLLRQLRREEPPSRAMLAGKAFHYVMEHAQAGQILTTAEHDGFKFRFDLDCGIPLPRVRELKGEVEIDTPSGIVTLVGVVDGIDGAIHDYKLTGRFDAERYIDSYQWRCYLVMFGSPRFDYDIFVANEKDEEFVVDDYHRLPFYAYTGMRDHVVREVTEFADFITRHLPERVTTAAPVTSGA